MFLRSNFPRKLWHQSKKRIIVAHVRIMPWWSKFMLEQISPMKSPSQFGGDLVTPSSKSAIGKFETDLWDYCFSFLFFQNCASALPSLLCYHRGISPLASASVLLIKLSTKNGKYKEVGTRFLFPGRDMRCILSHCLLVEECVLWSLFKQCTLDKACSWVSECLSDMR